MSSLASLAMEVVLTADLSRSHRGCGAVVPWCPGAVVGPHRLRRHQPSHQTYHHHWK